MALPKEFGNWHTIYVNFNRWSKNGTIQRIFEELQKENIIDIQGGILCIDSTSIKVNPDATGAKKNKWRAKYWPFKRGLTMKIHAICTSEKFALKIQLSSGNRHDALEDRKLINANGFKAGRHLLMDHAYEDDETRALVLKQGLIPNCPTKKE